MAYELTAKRKLGKLKRTGRRCKVEFNEIGGVRWVPPIQQLAMETIDMTTETAVSKSADNREAIEAISSVIQTYVEGGRKGDAGIMKSAFREDATIHGHIGGGLLAGPIHLLFDWVAGNPPAPDLEAEIVNVDLADTVATARVELTDWLGSRFTDQFTLLNENGAWTITSKVFHTH